MRKINFRKSETIFFEGDIGEQCYKIISGSVEIRMSIPGVMKRKQSEVIATCSAGEIIGEMSIIDQSPRSATAVATEPTVCVAYSTEEILDALQNDPQEALSYVRTLIRRVRRSNRKVSWSASRSA
ncbi:MAG: cyclic nucleotide-binding domain-containing protein [Alphaproteobacteria bacterium]